MNELQALTKEELMEKYPIAFATEPTNPKLSDKYSFVSTSEVIDHMDGMGWKVSQIDVKKARTRVRSKHMVRFFNPNIYFDEGGTRSYPQLLMTNSFDGSTSLRFRAGIFRMICSNGMVVATQSFGNFASKHKGLTMSDITEMVNSFVSTMKTYTDNINRMLQVELTQEQQFQLALDALLIRRGIDKNEEGVKIPQFDEETVQSILEPRRKEDEGDNLWVVFNRVQEAVVKGGIAVKVEGQKSKKGRKLRPIKNFVRDVKINEKLYSLLEAYN